MNVNQGHAHKELKEELGKHQIKEALQEMLIQEDFTSKWAISAISEKELDYFLLKGISRGQVALLRKYVCLINSEQQRLSQELTKQQGMLV